MRLKSSLPVEFRLYHRKSNKITTEWLPGIISEISRDGVCVETDTVMINGLHIFTSAMDDEFFLTMKISLPDGSNTVEAMGNVAWYNLAPETSTFRFIAGVLLTKIEHKSKKYWTEFISETQKSESLP